MLNKAKSTSLCIFYLCFLATFHPMALTTFPFPFTHVKPSLVEARVAAEEKGLFDLDYCGIGSMRLIYKHFKTNANNQLFINKRSWSTQELRSALKKYNGGNVVCIMPPQKSRKPECKCKYCGKMLKKESEKATHELFCKKRQEGGDPHNPR